MIRFILFSFFLLSLHAHSYELFQNTNLKCQMNLGLTNEILNSNSSSSGSTASNFSQLEFRPQVVYFLSSDIAVGGYYFQKSLLADFNSFGIGAFIRYYYLGQGSVIKSKIENKTTTLAPTFAPYVDFGGKRETLEAETISVSFSGFDIATGVDWHWSHGYFLNLGISLSSQLSGKDRSLFSQTIMFGLGKSLSF